MVERWGRMRYTKNRIDELVADVKRLKSQGVKFLCKRAIENGQCQLTPVEKELLKKGIDDAKNFQDFLAVALAAMMAG